MGHCAHCGQRVTWQSGVNAGTTRTLLKIAQQLKQKGQNIINPKKEMLDKGLITTTEYNNLSHLTKNGLIAKVQGEPSNFALTGKGERYLRGDPIAKYVVVQKSKEDTGSMKIDESEEQVTIAEVLKGEVWSQPNIEIYQGRVLDTYPLKTTANGQTTLL